MGLLDSFKRLSLGNFGLITRNWAYTYCRLNQFHKKAFISPEAVMIGASVINGNTYLLKQQFSMDDLHDSLIYAQDGQCCVTLNMPNLTTNSFPIEHGSPAGFNKDGEATFELMLNYCVQYVGLLLAIDTPRINSHEVMMATVRAKPKIQESLEMLFRDLRYGKGQNFMMNIAITNAMEMNADFKASHLMKDLMLRGSGTYKSETQPLVDTSKNSGMATQANAGLQNDSYPSCKICSESNFLVKKNILDGKEYYLCRRHQEMKEKPTRDGNTLRG